MALFGGITLPDRPDLENVRRLDLLPIPMIRQMMRYGMRVDLPHFAALSARFQSRMAELRKDITDVIPADALDRFVDVLDAGADEDDASEVRPEFNVDSAKQTAELLYDVLRLHLNTAVKMKRTKGGGISTGKKTLEQLKRMHPVVPLILEYRECSKLDGTYAKAMPRRAVLHPKGPDCPLCGRRHWSDSWRVHTQIMTTRTATGRTASKNPNLANIPARSKAGAEIRAGFIADEGCVIAQRDFAQIELRLMADRSGDPVMLEVYRNDGDIHIETAMRTFGIPREQVDKMLHRAPSKNTNFAVCIAKGQRLLTNRGLVPIEDVTPDMLLWDGVGWVPHSGVISKGVQHVITYEGITATPDHKVWLQDGRLLPLSSAMAEGARLAVGAVETTPVGYVGGTGPIPGSEVSQRALQKVWRIKASVSYQFEDGPDAKVLVSERIPIPRSLIGQQILATPIYSDSPEVREYEIQGMGELRWPWDREQIPNPSRVRLLCAGEPTAPDIQGSGHREDRQQRTLRTGEPSAGDAGIQSEEYAAESVDRIQGGKADRSGLARQVESGLSRLQPKPDTDKELGCGGGALDGNSEESSAAEMEAEVFDVLNCGPRRRFTCEGKVVSNCYLITGAGLLDLMASTFAVAGQTMPDYMDESWCTGFIAKWFGVYKGVRVYLDREEEKIRRYGIGWTPCGRVRRIPEVRSTHEYIQEAGVRQGGNHGIQGYSADIMKLAMGEEHARLQRLAQGGVEAWPLMTIYDELLIECPEGHGETVEASLEDVMDNVLVDKDTGVLQCKVQIKSDGKILTRWTKE